MGNKLIRTGVLLLFFTLMGGFVLYKMGFFKDRKEKSLEYSIGIYDDEVEEKDIIHSTKSFGGNSGIRIQDFINREDSIRDSIKRAKQFLMLSSKSGVVLDLEKDVDLIFENLKEEELTRLKQNEDSLQRILMGSSKSRMIFDSDDIKQAEFKTITVNYY